MRSGGRRPCSWRRALPNIAREVVGELDVEDPRHAFDAPVAANARCEALDVERSRGDAGAGFESGAVGIFGAILRHKERADGVEARLAGIAPIGADPIDLGGGDVGPGFDAAVPLLNGGLDHHFVAWRGAEILGDIGFERGLIALEREQVVGAEGDDLVGDRDLAAHGVDAGQRPFERSARSSRSSGMAVISLVFSGTLHCANTRRVVVA